MGIFDWLVKGYEETANGKIAFTRGDRDIYIIDANGANEIKVGEGLLRGWSPDGKKIAFLRFSVIYLVNADSTNETAIGGVDCIDDAIVWSPDGKKIAFESKYGKICVANADGTNEIDLTERGENPTWSPDGRKIAFDDEDLECIHVINPDGTNKIKLTEGGDPSWSPNGKKIAFVRENNIYVINDNGTNEVKLSYGWSLVWSPDGEKIAFRTSEIIGSFYVINADGTNKIELTEEGSGEGRPVVWSPDGRKIAFKVYGEGIYVVNTHGHHKIRIGKRGWKKNAEHPTWSPDGKKIAFETHDDRYFPVIPVVNARLLWRNEIELTHGSRPYWSPR